MRAAVTVCVVVTGSIVSVMVLPPAEPTLDGSGRAALARVLGHTRVVADVAATADERVRVRRLASG